MNVLILGSGGREHALAWKCAQNVDVDTVFVAPGNAGTATEAKLQNVALDVSNHQSLIDFANSNDVVLTIVGPEAPLVDGVVDSFEAAGLKIFGPRKKAAQLEGSKQFAKDFLARHNIPTAFYDVFTDVAAAHAYIDAKGAPIVVKADGLAAGKGVVVAQTIEEAKAAVTDMLEANSFGEAGSRVVIEEFLIGEEASFIVMVDGEDVLPMATSQDHKARDNGDLGPNTGGMGAYSPAPIVDDAMYQRVMTEVIYPTVKGMVAEDNYFRGFLYAGLMISPEGIPKVLEFNVRFGDPETQPIMSRLESDLVAHCLAAIDGTLATETAQWDDQVALGVVMAAGGYPFSYEKGDVISGIEEAREASLVFHAGTTLNAQNEVTTNGGRVLCVVAKAASVAEAQNAAYKAVDKISWSNEYHRTDIGFKAIR
ncbi:MAG: phosphoribosylamine--glycine ligase [Gammaproteobacteria bacterium]|nr:phosphoribosylamine--glycine ligase [Gammaproteobacteria bacterium]